MIRNALIASLVVVASGCSSDGSPALALRRDSAGIQIIENPGDGLWASASPWTLVEAATIGEVNGTEEYTFNRIADITTIGGHVFVLDAGDLVVKRYTVSGEHTSSFGRRGQGPGEFQIPLAMTSLEDTVIVMDALPAQLVRFTLDGIPSGARPVAINPIRDGITQSLIALDRGYAFVLATGCRNPVPADPRPRWKLVTTGQEGVGIDTVLSHVARNQLAVYVDGTCTSLAAFAQPAHSVAFSSEGRMYYSSGVGYEIRIHDPELSTAGMRYAPQPDRIIRRTADPVAISAAARQGYESASLELESIRDDPERIAALRAAWDSIGRMDYWPAVKKLAVDNDGYLWVLRHGSVDQHQQFDVFHPDGAFLGTVRLPSDMDVEEIRDGMVWGVLTDELGVQTIKGYEVQGRPASRLPR